MPEPASGGDEASFEAVVVNPSGLHARPAATFVKTAAKFDALVEIENVDAGLTSTGGAIAETGSLWLWPTQDEPRLLSLVPPIHIAVLDADSIDNTFYELMTSQRWSTSMPTNALLISGPSKTADIEQTLAYGVHGPKELLVLVRH